MTTQKAVQTDPAAETVQLKDPILAAFLAWLIPGLGHAYQGRWAKAVLFFVCIMGTFAYGLYLGSDREVGWGRVVYAAWDRDEKRWPYLAQVWVGLPAMPALIQAIRVRSGEKPFGTFMAPPCQEISNPKPGWITVDMIHRRLARYFELGTTYTFIAGLLNVLVILDAWAGPVVPVGAEKKDDEEDEDAKGSSGDDSKSDTPA